MHTFKILSLILLLAISVPLLSQNMQQPGKRGQGRQGEMPAIGQINGVVEDSISGNVVEYATVALFSKRNQELVNGTFTQKNGRFFIDKIPPGRYFIKISFMGYKDQIISDITISKEQSIINLDRIKLQASMESLDEVVIDGSAPRIDYQIDKKVINVSKQITSISGTAVDVLENVPSVKVDIEGNVSLRGSTGFTVLIDGRPSVLDANDALQQIPASTIDNIEIITNPSAKFDPDGTAGIINIIIKKNKLQGFSGVVNLNAGLNDKYGSDILVNYKKRNVNIYFGADYNVRNNPGESYNERHTYTNETSYKTITDGTNNRERNMWGFRTGLDYSFSPNDIIGLGFRFGERRMDRTSNLEYDEWITPGDIHNLYENYDESTRGGNFYYISGNYQHKFKKQGHDVKLEFSYSNRDFEDNSINELKDEADKIVDGRRNIEEGPSSRIRAKVDYTIPVGEKDKFEAGFQTRFSNSKDYTELHILDTSDGVYKIQPEYSNSNIYQRNIHALYTIYAGEFGKLGYQGGLRAEYTFRNIESSNDPHTYGIDRWDIFPSIHLSYQLPKDHQLMTSYTRRIERSRGWYLEPFITWVDAFNVRKGNPALLPEYIDSFELGYLKKIGKTNMISVEGYYRVTNNKVENVRSVFEENVMMSAPENVGKDYSLGIEFMLSFQLYKWWEVDLMGNFYKYKVEGILYDETFSNTSNNWSARFNNTFNIKKNTKIQINSMYNGPSVTAQGRSEGYYVVNAAVRQDFMDNKLSAVLQVSDIFSSAKHEFTTSGLDFYNYSEYHRESPIVTISISYRFNNYKPDNKSRSNDDEGSEMEEF
ncbi:MAG: TonB-dependent receptor [Bacteroidetes bacterium]|nr:TonB-dependent receptor [Bacteroidota bacterium]MBL6943865.1 TonB-dependent receptor [Bacteroidales bacterium]